MKPTYYENHSNLRRKGRDEVSKDKRQAGDIKGLKEVRIDERTVIYINPKHDEAEAVKRYQERNKLVHLGGDSSGKCKYK